MRSGGGLKNKSVAVHRKISTNVTHACIQLPISIHSWWRKKKEGWLGKIRSFAAWKFALWKKIITETIHIFSVSFFKNWNIFSLVEGLICQFKSPPLVFQEDLRDQGLIFIYIYFYTFRDTNFCPSLGNCIDHQLKIISTWIKIWIPSLTAWRVFSPNIKNWVLILQIWRFICTERNAFALFLS